MIKSGSDFKEFSKISITFDDNSNRPSAEITKIEITSDIEEDVEMKKITEEFLGKRFFITGYVSGLLKNAEGYF